MHKISNFTGKITTPSMGFGGQRQQHDLPPMPPPGMKHSRDPACLPRKPPAPYLFHNLSFNVPFSSHLAGPDPDDVIHASPNSLSRWTPPDASPKDYPAHMLPVHTENIDNLKKMCKNAADQSGGRLTASVISSEPKAIPGYQLAGKTAVTNVCLSGDPELVKRERGRILNSTPISLRATHVDVDQNLFISAPEDTDCAIRKSILDHVDNVSQYTGANIFILKSKKRDDDTRSVTGSLLNGLDQKFRIAIYGDLESSEHAKTRILIMIDQILKRKVDFFKIELTMHSMICGRLRRHVKHIESATNTAIYFPPPFPQVHGYCAPGARQRRDDEIYITGERDADIYRAKNKMSEIARSTQTCVKEIRVSSDKIDNILLERLDQIRDITEFNGSYVLFPRLGTQHGAIRVQGTDMLHVERTIREVMSVSGDYYAATWEMMLPDGLQPFTNLTEIRQMLADICISSGAETNFDQERLAFHICGPAGAVKSALLIISMLPFVKRADSVLHVKIELANEHKEFVSGKKNGKINKIMTQSGVQVFFDLFNEYNFFIDICGNNYNATKNGLDLVEQEMPSSIDFHVPDQYHKRIIGVGGQHIQQIMKKHSVFVKFTNAMDRGGVSKEDADIKVNNVICRTPSRNSENLDLVKQEIMGMVDRTDSEIISEDVHVDRLYQRVLLTRMHEVEELEKKWNCKVNFPRTESASDFITVTGPESQIPDLKDEFLGKVPKSHELSFRTTEELSKFIGTEDFQKDVVEKLKQQYEVDLRVNSTRPESANGETPIQNTERLTLYYTCNNLGGFEDSIDFLTTKLLAHGLDKSTMKGAIPRPKSDSFDNHALFFPTKLLHPTDPGSATDSPTRSAFGDDANEQRSFLARLRSKPGGAISSILGSRKSGARSPGPPIQKFPSTNVSKTSLVSLESQNSSYRNPWNDSGVNLADDENNGWPAQFINGNNSSGDLRRLQYAPSTVSLSGSSTALPPPGSSSGFPPGSAGLSTLTPTTSSASALSPGDVTPKHEFRHGSHDSGRPSTSNSLNNLGYNASQHSAHSAHSAHSSQNSGPSLPGPIGPPPKSAGS